MDLVQPYITIALKLVAGMIGISAYSRKGANGTDYST